MVHLICIMGSSTDEGVCRSGIQCFLKRSLFRNVKINWWLCKHVNVAVGWIVTSWHWCQLGVTAHWFRYSWFVSCFCNVERKMNIIVSPIYTLTDPCHLIGWTRLRCHPLFCHIYCPKCPMLQIYGHLMMKWNYA